MELIHKNPKDLTTGEVLQLQQYASQLSQELSIVRQERNELEADLKEVGGVIIEAAKAVNIEKMMKAKNIQVALMQEIGSMITPNIWERDKKPLVERFAFFSKLGPIYMKHKDKFEDLNLTTK